jgi:hypothetical protein
MLSTINGFDLLLIVIITLLGFKVYNLNRECESYVGQIIQMSWDLQKEIQANVMWEDFHKSSAQALKNDCAYCAGREDFRTGDECICPPF